MITRSQKNNFNYVSLDYPSKRQRVKYDSDNNSFINNLDIESEIVESSIESESYVSNTESENLDTKSENESENSDNESNNSDNESNTYTVTENSDSSSESETIDSGDSTIVNKDGDINNAFEKEYDMLEHNLYSVLDGSFFEGYNLEYSLNYLKKKFTLSQMQELNNKLFDLKNQYDNENLNIIDMLNKNYSVDKQKQIVEKIYNITNSDILTAEYNTNIEELNKLINEKDSEEMIALEKQIINNINNYNNSYKSQILQSKMSFNNKVIAYKFLKIMESYNNNSSEELIKYKTWLNTLLNIPFGNYQENVISIDSDPNKINDYIFNVRNILDKHLSFLEKPKDQIINIITHMIRNPKTSINGIGIYGPKGTGKSSLIDSIGKALDRPVIRISLGGSNDANVLNGHDFTYIGSRQGKIIDAIINSKIMNPIIHFDEIDKISNNHHGQEIFNTLLHLTDSTTNNQYNCDNYFAGIEFDLSRILFIFTYNDPNNVDPIFADRIYKINITNYSYSEKFSIIQNHLINNILKSFNFKNDDISFTEESIKYLIEKSKNSDGMRTIKNNIQIIISRINTLLLIDESQANVIQLNYKKLYKNYRKLPVLILKYHIDLLLEDSIYEEYTELKYPHMYL